MALGDVGIFNPAESHYGTPGAFDKMLQADAQKRAAYLSSMDQYYENLAESKRQFNETLGFKVETRDLELEWAREKQEKELTFDRERLEWEKTYGSRMLDLKEREVAGEELDFFEKNRLWRMMEKEGESRRDVREESLEYPSALITPGSFWEGPGTRRDEGAPQSGEVSPMRNLGRQAKDYPNWKVPVYGDEEYPVDPNEYDYP